MGTLQKDQTGFSGVELLLTVIILVLVGFAGWYIYHTDHKPKVAANQQNSSSSAQTTNKQTATEASKTYVDPANVYKIGYPSDWAASTQPAPGVQPASLVDPESACITPANSPEVSTVQSAGEALQNCVEITAFQSGDTSSVLSAFASGDSQTTPQSLTINGYSAIYQQSTESANAPTYTDDVYAVSHNGVTLVLSFREKQGTDSLGTPTFDATSTVPAYTALVKSVKFLN